MITAMVLGDISSWICFSDGSVIRRRGDMGFCGSGIVRKAMVHAAICAVAIAWSAGACLAQRTTTQGNGANAPSQSPNNVNPLFRSGTTDPFGDPEPQPGVIIVSPDSARTVDSEACNSWTESGIHSPTVSVTRLEVPDKASGEFQKGCSSYKDKKFAQAETHLRKAIEIYPDYAASWVLLGQVLDAEHNREEAVKACSQGATADPHYIAPYLCLAEFAARDEDWDQVSRLSDEALAIDPVSNAYALYYSADANLHLQHLSDAERNARAAIPLDPWHHLPQLHLLLAHIYDAKGDQHAAAAELKDYLKQASSSADAPAARAELKQFETQPPIPPQDAPAGSDKSPQGTAPRN